MQNDPIKALRSALPPGIELTEYLNKGGQGVVFRGTCDGQRAAIKVYFSGNDERRLVREVGLLSKIRSPHVVRILRHEVIVLDGARLHVVAYEFLRGGDLRAMLNGTSAPASVKDILRIGAQVGLAVDLLWQNRVVHRDIKPDNILRAEEDRFVLVDFGLSRMLDRSNITRPGVAPGTRGYMSPEQAKGRQSLTVRSDVYSLGMTLYELATGKHPFGWDQTQVDQRDPPPLHKLRRDIPEAACSLIHRMLARVSYNRPATVSGDFLMLLEGT